MAENKSSIFYAAVSANSVEELSYVIPNGKILDIRKISGNAAIDTEVKVEVIFDGNAIFATHTSAIQEYLIQLVGDGVKELKIRLVNDSPTQETIGGLWEGVLV